MNVADVLAARGDPLPKRAQLAYEQQERDHQAEMNDQCAELDADARAFLTDVLGVPSGQVADLEFTHSSYSRELMYAVTKVDGVRLRFRYYFEKLATIKSHQFFETEDVFERQLMCEAPAASVHAWKRIKTLADLGEVVRHATRQASRGSS